MAYQRKRLVLGAVGGFMVAMLIISGVMFGGIIPGIEIGLPTTTQGPTDTGTPMGMLIIMVKDDPADLQELWLKISGVKVHMKGDGDETWKDVQVVATEQFDLLKLQDVSEVLAVGELPAGNYTEIRFTVVEASAKITGEENLKPLRISAPWEMVKVHFTIKEVPITRVTLDIIINEEPILKSGHLQPVSFSEATVEYVE